MPLNPLRRRRVYEYCFTIHRRRREKTKSSTFSVVVDDFDRG